VRSHDLIELAVDMSEGGVYSGIRITSTPTEDRVGPSKGAGPSWGVQMKVSKDKIVSRLHEQGFTNRANAAESMLPALVDTGDRKDLLQSFGVDVSGDGVIQVSDRSTKWDPET
jgi:hypothetical protein